MKIDQPTHRWKLTFEGEWPTSVAFLDNHRLAAGNRAGQILFWKLPDEPPAAATEQDGEQAAVADHVPLRMLTGHTNEITHLRAIGDGKTLISASLDRSICVWDVDAVTGEKAEVIVDAQSRQQRARNRRGEDKDAILNAPGLEMEVVAATQRLQRHEGWIFALDVSADGKRLISGDDRCLTVVWDIAAGEPISSWHGYDRVWVRSAALSPDGETAFTCEYAGRRSNFDCPAAQARLWNVADGSMKRDLLRIWTPDVKDKDRADTYGYMQKWNKLIKRGLVCAQFSPDGKWLAVGQGGETDTGKVHVVDMESGEIARTISGHRYGVCDLKFSADGQYILSSGRDTAVRICQVADGKEVAVLGESRGGQFKDWIAAIAISPDQKLVAAADIAGMIQVWQLAQ